MHVLTDKIISNILDNMIIVSDTREQKNQHILEYFKNNHIRYIERKLDSGDYSFIVPDYPELELDECVIIEKKNSLDEISQNFTKGRKRFINEFERIPEGTDVHLVIENATWKKLLKGSYRSKLSPKSFMASIFSFSIKYNIKTWFTGKDESPEVIYNLLYYGLRDKLNKYK